LNTTLAFLYIFDGTGISTLAFSKNKPGKIDSLLRWKKGGESTVSSVTC
jgi:hypothetical protein